MTSTARASRSRWPSQNAAHPVAAVLTASARAGTSATPRVCAAMTAVNVARRAPANDRMSGQRPNTAVAVGNDPANALHQRVKFFVSRLSDFWSAVLSSSVYRYGSMRSG